jgi:hypothetical protein
MVGGSHLVGLLSQTTTISQTIGSATRRTARSFGTTLQRLKSTWRTIVLLDAPVCDYGQQVSA